MLSDLVLNVVKQKQGASSQYDKGIAYIVEKHRTTSDQSTRERIAKALGVQNATLRNSKNDTNKQEINDSILLPPRVALEHADASVRKAAMEQLVEQYDHNNNNDDADNSLLAALLRHFVMEDELEMKLAAASAIEKHLSAEKVHFNKDACDLVMQAFSRNSSNAGGVLEMAIKIAGHALSSVIGSESDDAKKPLIVILVAHCESFNKKSTEGVPTVAWHAICSAFSEKKSDMELPGKSLPRTQSSRRL